MSFRSGSFYAARRPLSEQDSPLLVPRVGDGANVKRGPGIPGPRQCTGRIARPKRVMRQSKLTRTTVDDRPSAFMPARMIFSKVRASWFRGLPDLVNLFGTR